MRHCTGPIAILISCALVGACNAPDKYATYERRLDTDLKIMTDVGGLERASGDLEAMLAETQQSPETAAQFVVQSYYAAYLLTVVHVRASLGAPFLPRVAAADSSFMGESFSTGAEVPHIVATMAWAALTEDLLNAAKGSSLSVGDQELRPEGLRDLSPDAAYLGVQFAELVGYARLHLDDRNWRHLDAAPQLYDLTKCEGMLKQSKINESLYPWVYEAIFSYLVDRGREPEAYKFGIRLIATSHSAGGELNQAVADAKQWILYGSQYEFKCRTCGKLVDPEVAGCERDSTPNLDFDPSLRTTPRANP